MPGTGMALGMAGIAGMVPGMPGMAPMAGIPMPGAMLGQLGIAGTCREDREAPVY